ncbi:MAG: capsular polysaccharide biosynthesis protein [Oscillospiraceae bacterium]|nr:capsular polysaccharide biosynthesis protein [Oscillospiraceae bacterium]
MNKVVDFHSHILPGIDDGSASLEESIAMLKIEAEQGIEHVIATPHFYPLHDSPEQFLKRRDEAEARLREEMEKHSGLPKLSVGAEVYYFSGISDSDIIQGLTIDKKRCILLEMPHTLWTDRMYREMEDIWTKQGITPIIAHVDRYIAPFRTHRIPQKLGELPVLVQANASFFIHSATKRMALRMLKDDQVHLLGSDCHNLSTRAPNLGAAVRLIEQQLGPKMIERINFNENEVLIG